MADQAYKRGGAALATTIQIGCEPASGESRQSSFTRKPSQDGGRVRRPKDRAPHSADTRAKDGQRGFAGIPRCVLKSEAYRTLSLIARAILVELVVRMDGRNNGKIGCSYATLASSLNRRNQAPMGPAIAELMTHGLIDISAESVWKERKAREYRLTFVNTTDGIGRPIKATNDYLGWTPEPKCDTTDAVAAKTKSATAFVANKIAAATDGVATSNAKLPKTSGVAATDGVIHICKPYANPVNGGAAHLGNLPERLGRSTEAELGGAA